MGGLFGHTWTSKYGDNPEGIGGDTWAAALADVSPAQIANGLRETLATGSEFPPSAPRFRAMCFGIPSLASVRYTLRSGAYDRFAVLVRSKLDAYVFARVDQKTADRMIGEAYELARDHIMRGGFLPAEPIAHIEPPKTDKPVRAPAAVARPYVESLAKLLGETDESISGS